MMSNKFSTNQIEQLLNSSIRNKGDYNNLDLSLSTVSYLLDDNNSENVVSYINKLLKSSRNDEEVYTHLKSVITCISKDILFQNITFWIQCIVDRKNGLNKKYDIISNLIQLGKENQDFNKLMHSSLLLKIIEECLLVEINNIYIGSALACLATCLDTYPGSCGQIKNKIELYLIQFLYSKTINIKLIKYAAVCFQQLQKVGSPGIDAINHKNNWKISFEKLNITMDLLYDQFLEDIDEFYSYEKLILDPYTLPDLPKVISSAEVFYVLENRLQNTCFFLRGMLENEFSHPKCIHPQHVLDIITRALSLHICVNRNNSDSTFHFGILLIRNQINILYLLRSVIASLELNLLQFSASLSKLLIDCLTRPQNCNCFINASEYTETIYKVLDVWIKTLRNCLNINVHDKLVNLIIENISPITADISLNIINTNDRGSGKTKKKAMQEKIISSSIKHSSLENFSENLLKSKEKICYQALSCLSTLLRNVDLSIKDNTSSLLYKTLTQAIFSIQNGRKLFPYYSDKIKVKLFEALLATLECYRIPQSIGLITNLLREGLKSNNASISYNCSMGLNLLEKICQPVCPSLNFMPQNSFIPNSDETMQELLEKSQPLMTYTKEEEDGQEIRKLKDADVFTETIECNISDTVTENLLENYKNAENEAVIEEVQTESENSVQEELSLSQPLKEESTSDQNYVVETNLNNFPTEKDCHEPVQKKIKMDNAIANLDINEMLSSFVDEISDDVV